ncbi:hypothetical protein HII31_09709 [Pseudocercospora fuligena]|uniref:Uncharacterized protein n=1 Tax=Pseudocercospora fuligena TaxID=685502 RepID=A0A8H6RCW6_9PEZI|nr:hypothetical protein HII31_09709 [Pseudocercospora fuligena]
MQFTHLTDLSKMETSIHVSPGLPFYALDFVLQPPTSTAALPAPVTSISARKRDNLASARDKLSFRKQEALPPGQTRYIDYDLVIIAHNLRAKTFWSFIKWLLRTYTILSLVTGIANPTRVRAPRFPFYKKAFAARLADNLRSGRWWVGGDETGGIAQTVALEILKMLRS